MVIKKAYKMLFRLTECVRNAYIMRMTFNDFKPLRERQCLTQIEFSVKHDISVSVIQALENGAADRCSRFSPSTIRRVADAYGVEVSEVIQLCKPDAVAAA